jgi:hypothetical protein
VPTVIFTTAHAKPKTPMLRFKFSCMIFYL